MAKTYNLAYQESESFYFRFKMRDASGAALDLTGALVEWAVAAADGSGTTLLATTSNGLITVTSAVNGEGYVLVDPADHGDIVDGEYTHELRATLADTTVTSQIIGRLTVGTSPFPSVSPSSFVRASGLQLLYDSGTSDADPGDGEFRFNNASAGSATFIYVDLADRYGVSITTWLEALDDSTSTASVRGHLRFAKIGQESTWYEFAITGAVVTATGYRKIPVSYVAGAGTLTNGDAYAVLFSRTGDKGDSGGMRWNFDSSTTTGVDPGDGDLRLNNASFASVTTITVADECGETGNPDASAWLATWDDSSSDVKGTLILKKVSAPQNFAIYRIVTGSDGTTHWDFTVTHVSSSGSFTNGDALSIQFNRTGDKGVEGVTSTDYQESVRLAATANVTLSGEQTIDGVAGTTGNRILTPFQTTEANRRVWIMDSGAWTIAEGWDVGDAITSGTLVPVEEGATYAGMIAQLLTANPITLGTTALNWDFLDGNDVFISNFIGRSIGSATATLGLSYNKNWVHLTRNGVQTVTVPNNALSAHAIGTEIVVQMIGTGTKTIDCGASVILNGASAGTGTVTITTSRDAYILKKRAINSWEAVPWKAPTASGAPTDADYLVKTANGSLSAERVVTDTTEIAVDWATAGQAKFGFGSAVSAFAKTILDDADEAEFKATVNLEIGTDVQAWDAFLDDIGALTDPGADRILFWDDSDGNIGWLEASTGLSISGTAITANVSGKQTIYVPASAMLSATTSGAASAQIEMATNKQNIGVLDFDATADEYAHFQVAFPKSWNLGTVTFQVFWTTSATDTDGVAWGLEAVARSDNEAIDTAWGTAVVVTDDAQSAANEQLVTAESSAVTIAGTPADDDLVYFRLFRDVSDANDDMTEDARLIGIKLFYTTDSNNDA